MALKVASIPSGAVVKIFREGIVGPKLQAMCQVAAKINLEGVVVAGTAGRPRRCIGDQRIRFDRPRVVNGSDGDSCRAL